MDRPEPVPVFQQAARRRELSRRDKLRPWQLSSFMTWCLNRHYDNNIEDQYNYENFTYTAVRFSAGIRRIHGDTGACRIDRRFDPGRLLFPYRHQPVWQLQLLGEPVHRRNRYRVGSDRRWTHYNECRLRRHEPGAHTDNAS